MIAIIAIIVVVFLQFRYGWITREQTLPSVLLNMSPSVGIALVYTFWLLIKTPWLLDVDRQQEADGLGEKIITLNQKFDSLTSEMTRPKFRIKNPQMVEVGEFDEDERYHFTFKLENIGSREASEVISRVIIVDEGKTTEPKVREVSVANEIPINDPLTMHLEMKCSRGDPPIQIVVAIRFKDAIPDKVYTQAFFLKWEGIKRGVIPEIQHLTAEEREQLMERLKQTVGDLSSDSG